MQGLILSSLFWGYALSQIPASQAALYVGPKVMLIIGGVGSGLLTIAIPWIASYSWKLLLVVRMILGLFQGIYFPCTHMVLSKWAHPSERARLASVTYSGTNLGSVIMLGISGVIAASFLGWPGIFYCSGTISLVWSLLIMILLSNEPANCKKISKDERLFLDTVPGSSSAQQLTVPWKEIFASKPMIALIIVHSAQSWGFWTMLTMVPTYMKQVLGFDIKTVSEKNLTASFDLFYFYKCVKITECIAVIVAVFGVLGFNTSV